MPYHQDLTRSLIYTPLGLILKRSALLLLTAGMNPTVFDYTRVDSTLYGNLETPRQSVDFINMVTSYLGYLRSKPVQGCEVDALEMETLDNFIQMVDHDETWLIVRRYVPEFKTESSPDLANVMLYKLHNAVLHRISSSRLPQPRPSRIQQIEQFESDLLWNRFKAQVEYLAFNMSTTNLELREKRRAEVQEVLDHFVDAVDKNQEQVKYPIDTENQCLNDFNTALNNPQTEGVAIWRCLKCKDWTSTAAASWLESTPKSQTDRALHKLIILLIGIPLKRHEEEA